MKAKQCVNKSFRPVHLILETQAEVDGIFALLNHVRISDAVGLGGSEYIEPLRPYHKSSVTDSLHHELSRLLE